ncbi:MAG: sulfite exporter TauE/SafE family protein [Myxococcales bacterium]|nr:sulfite exporter TauE/SafE family protein [Myxococcales bacterium]
MTLADPRLLRLPLIVLLAFVVESTAGFGATIVTVTLGALFLPIDTVLAQFLPVNVLLSAYLVGSARRAVDRRLLFRSMLPWIGVGVAVGLVVARLRFDRALLPAYFGAFVVVLSVAELARRSDTTPPKLGPLVRSTALLGAGVVHGLFASAGPLVVWVAAREVEDKTAFRATLAALWLVLNVVVLGGFVYDGAIGRESLRASATLLVPLVLGTAIGHVLHRRASPRAFRLAVYVLLLAAGLTLVARPLLASR